MRLSGHLLFPPRGSFRSFAPKVIDGSLLPHLLLAASGRVLAGGVFVAQLNELEVDRSSGGRGYFEYI